jgi:hypothetical protein
MDLMVEDENESIMDTISTAVETQKGNAPEPKEEAAPEPTEEAAEAPESETRARDASGKFLPKEGASKVAKEAETEPEHTGAVDKLEEQPDPNKADISRPPRRLPIRTKGIWQTLPETVREDIWAREKEYDTAFKRYDGLGTFVMAAEKNGTNLPAALADYSAMETALRRDPIEGALAVWQRMGYNPQAVVQELVRRAGGQSDGQPTQSMQAPMPPGLTRQEMEMEFSRRENMAKIEAFENDPKHIYLEPLNPMGEQGPIRSAMIHFLTPAGPGTKPLANSLEDAYDMALRVHPEIARPNGQGSSSVQAQKTAAVNQSRAAAKAIGGAPSHGSNVGQKSPDDGNQSVFDTVRAAVARQRG